MSIHDIIKLNIGGMKYVTTRSTLTKYPDSMLTAMFIGEIPARQDDKGGYFIDRNHRMFEYVLQFLRCGKLILPDDFKELELLKVEADFYQLQPLITAINEYEVNIQRNLLVCRGFRTVLICSFHGHGLHGESVNHQQVFTKGENSKFYLHTDSSFNKRLRFENFMSYLENEKTWMLVKKECFGEITAAAYFLSIGMDESPFRKDVTYSTIDIQLWKSSGIELL